MISVDYTTSGVMAFATRGGRSFRQRTINRLWSRALGNALSLYATGKLRGANILDRFKPGADKVYGFSGRTAKYDEWQKRTMGTTRPYFSPRGTRRGSLLPLAKQLVNIANGRTISAKALVNALARGQNRDRSKPHMRDIVRVPGRGHNIITRGKGKMKTTIKWPGARILNRLKHRAPEYRREFADLRMGGGRDIIAIMRHAKSAYLKDFKELAASLPRKRGNKAE